MSHKNTNELADREQQKSDDVSPVTLAVRDAIDLLPSQQREVIQLLLEQIRLQQEPNLLQIASELNYTPKEAMILLGKGLYQLECLLRDHPAVRAYYRRRPLHQISTSDLHWSYPK